MFKLADSTRSSVITIALIMWATSIACGFCYLAAYSNTPGQPARETLQQWPEERQLASAPSPALVIFLHPKCVCSRATLAEFARLQTHYPQLPVSFVFYTPGGQPAQWCETELWTTAEKLSAQPPTRDWDGQLARQLGATTSGHAFLLSADGRVLYSGGLTGARGHEGDNAGRETVYRLLNGDLSADETIIKPVYGCSLQSRSAPGTDATDSAKLSQQMVSEPRAEQ